MCETEFEPNDGGMIVIDPVECINRRITPIFFMIDNSKSMEGSKMATVNSAMEEIMNDLKNFNNADAELRFAVLSFGVECRWETGEGGLISCDGFWNELSAADVGLTCFNTACSELKEKLSGSHGFFKFAAGKTITPPVLVLMTDGNANDGNKDGETGIAELSGNKYFNGSYKVAIAIGKEANQKLCENFTGDKELVYTAYNSLALKKILEGVIKCSVAVSSSGTSDTQVIQEPDPVKPRVDLVKRAIEEEFEEEELTDINIEIDDNDWD
ncbi:MAG: VWA domain-containing protein [Ruminococcus sp.]|nr:VWA domain-containing protein [Ruminococcus sp.]